MASRISKTRKKRLWVPKPTGAETALSIALAEARSLVDTLLASYNEMRETRRRKAQLKCKSCDCRFRISDAVWLDNYWYERPHGCTGGATWHRGLVEMDRIQCTHCGHRNYIYNFAEKESLVALRDCAKERVKDHRR